LEHIATPAIIINLSLNQPRGKGRDAAHLMPVTGTGHTAAP